MLVLRGRLEGVVRCLDLGVRARVWVGLEVGFLRRHVRRWWRLLLLLLMVLLLLMLLLVLLLLLLLERHYTPATIVASQRALSTSWW